MLPSVDPGVFQRNPNFESLYKDLCTRKLNPDGSTQDRKKQRMHEEIRRTLITLLTNHHSTRTLTTTLSTLPSKANPPIAPDLHLPIELLTAQLSNHISLSDRALLEPSLSTLLTHLPTIAAALSTHLHTAATLLSTISDPVSPPPTASLPSRASTLKTQAEKDLPAALHAATLQLANTAYQVLTTHRHLLTTGIRILEQTAHGALARASRTQAEYLHARAALLGVQARVHQLAHAPPDEVATALKGYKRKLEEEKRGLRDREGLAQAALDEYRRAGERGMRDLAGRKRVLVKEVARVDAEIGRLERGKDD